MVDFPFFCICLFGQNYTKTSQKTNFLEIHFLYLKKVKLQKFKNEIIRKMNTETYEYSADKEKLVYNFNSLGDKGNIPKAVIYENITYNHFNLAFGDYDVTESEINDKVVTDNGDIIKVLGTVIETIQNFFQAYPHAILDIRGSTPTRIKLYQRIIKMNLIEIQTKFNILAFRDSELSPEFPNFSQEYQCFQISKKYQYAT